MYNIISFSGTLIHYIDNHLFFFVEEWRTKYESTVAAYRNESTCR